MWDRLIVTSLGSKCLYFFGKGESIAHSAMNWLLVSICSWKVLPNWWSKKAMSMVKA